MADQRIRFIAEWVDKGLKRGAQDAENALSKVEQKTVSAGQNFLAMGTIIGTGAAALKKFYDIAKEGSQIEVTALRFDRLAVSIGTTADALDQQLYDATSGMLSQSERMALATDIVGLGLTKNADQTVRLARVVSQLGADMNQVTLALTNQTTARFDQIGIRVEGFQDKLKALAAQGYSTNEAFTEAFLQQGEQQLELFGSVADTSAGKIAIFEAQVKDLGDAIKLVSADALGSFLGIWVRINNLRIDGYLDSIEASFETWRAAIFGNTEALEELEAQQQKDIYATEGQRKAWEQLGITYGYAIEDTNQVADAQLSLADAMDAANLALGNQIDRWKEQIKWVDSGAEAFEKVAEAIRGEYDPALNNADEITKRLTSVQIDLMRTMGEFDGMSFDQIQSKLEGLGVPMNKAYLLASGIYAELQNINGLDVTATINIKTKGGTNVEVNAGTLLPTVTSNSGMFAQQAGGSIVIPPSYTGDSAIVRATAGERVTTETASNTRHDMLASRLERRRENRELANMIVEGILIGMR